ncbi:HEAT repeat domain-containing protein [Prosthecobacter sp.]|uniref:HEAT repeat domain-containing protein n=1 Tax=Prosthecobacter sp. TaxID=1965333 RepID=UPI001D91D6C3|nr:HEAT repeat domain-containing protein [Prosthecobacter sp.]MCB1278873.1 HEAT repeat domain-containing protein [Prosthecobacter sp.]
MIGRWFRLRRARLALASQDPKTRIAGLDMLPDLEDQRLAELVTTMAVTDPDLDSRKAAQAFVLKHASPLVIRFLRQHLLTSMQTSPRRYAAELLAGIGGTDSVNALAKAVEDFSFPEMQVLCARLLGQTREPAALPLLKKYADDAFWYPSRKRRAGGSGIDIGQNEAVAMQDGRTKTAALEGLAIIGGDEALAVIRRYTKSRDFTIRGTAEKLLREIDART